MCSKSIAIVFCSLQAAQNLPGLIICVGQGRPLLDLLLGENYKCWGETTNHIMHLPLAVIPVVVGFMQCLLGLAAGDLVIVYL